MAIPETFVTDNRQIQSNMKLHKAGAQCRARGITCHAAALSDSNNIQISDKLSRGLSSDKPTINHLTMARRAFRRVRM
jgi:hypothetical protein